MFFIFPAHGSQQLFLFMPPAGDFLSVAKERFAVVSAGFQPFVRRENRDTSSKPPCCIRHRRRFGVFAYFLSLLTKSMPSETKKKKAAGFSITAEVINPPIKRQQARTLITVFSIRAFRWSSSRSKRDSFKRSRSSSVNCLLFVPGRIKHLL